YPGAITSRAMEYAGLMGANIVSMSFESRDSADFVFMAQHPEMIFIVSTGNNGDSTVFNLQVNQLSTYNLPNLISVGATNIFDEKAAFSNYHSSVDVMAPGVGIISGIGTG